MSKLTKTNLIKTFMVARKRDAPFVFIGIEAEGVFEVISIPRQSFEDKLEYYTKAYTSELTHVMNRNVKITVLRYGTVEVLDEIAYSKQKRESEHKEYEGYLVFGRDKSKELTERLIYPYAFKDRNRLNEFLNKLGFRRIHDDVYSYIEGEIEVIKFKIDEEK